MEQILARCAGLDVHQESVEALVKHADLYRVVIRRSVERHTQTRPVSGVFAQVQGY